MAGPDSSQYTLYVVVLRLSAHSISMSCYVDNVALRIMKIKTSFGPSLLLLSFRLKLWI